MKATIKDMLGALVAIWIIAFLVLAFFSPWAFKLAQADEFVPQGSYNCTLTSSIGIEVIIPSHPIYQNNMVHGVNDTMAFGQCEHPVITGLGLDHTAVDCVFISSSGSGTDSAHSGNGLLIQRGEFVLTCNYWYEF